MLKSELWDVYEHVSQLSVYKQLMCGHCRQLFSFSKLNRHVRKGHCTRNVLRAVVRTCYYNSRLTAEIFKVLHSCGTTNTDIFFLYSWSTLHLNHTEKSEAQIVEEHVGFYEELITHKGERHTVHIASCAMDHCFFRTISVIYSGLGILLFLPIFRPTQFNPHQSLTRTPQVNTPVPVPNYTTFLSINFQYKTI